MVPVPQMVRVAERAAPKSMWAGRTLPASPHVTKSLLNGCHSHRLGTLGPLADVELNPLVFFKRSITVPADFCVVNEHILCAAVRSDKTEAFLAVEPFHSSLCHNFSTSLIQNGCTKNILTQGSRSVRHTNGLRVRGHPGARLSASRLRFPKAFGWALRHPNVAARPLSLSELVYPYSHARCSVDSERFVASGDPRASRGRK